MKTLKYPARFVRYYDDGEYYVVTFPDLKGCVTQGETTEEALFNATEALTGYLTSIFIRNLNIPEPSNITGDNIYFIEPDASISISINLKKLRQERGISQTELANMIGVKYQTYQRLENPLKSNPTIKTLSNIAKAFHRKLHVEIT
ncbi:MAG: type II toxin-antitoxin system HicB family antitoxin [Nitrospirae bacterium YQR-1]